MPMKKCPNPNCNGVRLVVDGKRKKCRKCGTPMTTNPPKPPKTEKLTVDDLKSQHPVQVAEIIKTAQVEALVEAAGQDPKIEAAVSEAVEAKTAKLIKTVDQMTVPKFIETFPKLYGKIEKAFANKVKADTKKAKAEARAEAKKAKAEAKKAKADARAKAKAEAEAEQSQK